MKALGSLLVLGVSVAFVWTLVHAFVGWRAHGEWCVGHARVVEGDRRFGELRAPLRWPAGCP